MSDDPPRYTERWAKEGHVECDEKCGALNEPVTEAELRAALEHWRDHGFLAGCSHGN